MATANENSPQPGRGVRPCLWATAAWTGAAVMAFELAGARLLMPDLGMGIEVWSAVIGATLGFLAVGYAAGGKIADAWPGATTLAAVLLLAAGSLLLVRCLGRSLPGLFTALPFVAAAWCSAALLLAAPLVLLGMVSPILARLLIRSTSQTGSVVGGLMAVGTVGGVLGTGLTALVLIPRSGVSNTIFLLGCGTATVAVLVLVGARRWRAAACAVAAGLLLAGAAGRLTPAPDQPGPMRVLEQVEGLYGHLEVVEHHGSRAIVCNGIFQTASPASEFGILPGTLIRGRDYVELIPYFRPRTRSGLLVGLGGGLHAQALACYGIKVHCVEIEPAMVTLAAKYFGLAAEVTVADGRAFLARDPRRFDAIVLDTFLGGTVPEHLYTREAFEQTAERLNPGGVLVVHLIGRPQHDATRAVACTLEAVFPHTAAVRSGLGDGLQHLYLFASREPVELQPEDRVRLDSFGFTGDEFFRVETAGASLLTDDRSCLGLLSRDLVAEHRQHSYQQRRRPSW